MASGGEMAPGGGLTREVVVLPLAATEQHGPHLPESTDVDIGWGILSAAVAALEPDSRPEVLPMIEVGVSEEHESFPNTRSIPAEEMVAAIMRIGGEVAGSGRRRLVLVNSHGGNRFAMDAAALRLRRVHGMLVVKASWFRFDRPADVDLPGHEWRHGLHGGAVETAMMMHLHPDRVRNEAIEDFASLGRDLEAGLRRLEPEGQASFAWLAEDLHPAGVTGDARLATPEMGERLVRHFANALAEVLLDAADFPLHRLARP
jgi:creatinine amidohydrolase